MPADDSIASIRRTYDQVPYRSHAFPFTHPRRLAAVARVAGGFDAPPVARCRVLELGCAGGGNILPMAAHLPEARFVGIDLSPVQIDAGIAAARTLRLTNVELRAMDIRDVSPQSLGTFDYIIAHGVWSWVPPAVQEQILAIFSRQLSPRGVAYVSFNVYPGRSPQMDLRELMLLHAAGAGEDRHARVSAAREVLTALGQIIGPPQNTPHATLLRNEVASLLAMDDAVLLHDSLAESNRPVYFRQFIEQARVHGLRYVGEAMPSTTAIEQFPPGVRDAIENLSRGNEIEREQLIDILRRRALRKCVLCCADDLAAAAAPPLPPPSTVAWHSFRELYAASNTRHTGMPGEFASPHGETFAIPDSSAAADLLRRLVAAWPASVRASELPEGDVALLVPLMRTGLIELDSGPPPPCTKSVPDRPIGAPVARLQAATSGTVTHLRHDQVTVPAAHLEVLRMLDGTRTTAQLVAERGSGVAGILSDLASNALLVATDA
jgi:2-polyprenyl-3-methyl-5-hydroxy-6-metoxy-1,4-benzoquinol methylase